MCKSGVSGAGKKPPPPRPTSCTRPTISRPTAVFGHRHTGELLEQLAYLTSDQIQFTPHLLPIPRGILSTIYLRLANKHEAVVKSIQNCFNAASTPRAPMVRVGIDPPSCRRYSTWCDTSFCDIGFQLGPGPMAKRLVLVSCLDNLLKGRIRPGGPEV